MGYAYEDVMPVAQEIKDLLAPGCKRIEIAGSLRRRCATVKDIEIVAEPILTPVVSLFGDIADYESQLDSVLSRIAQSFLAPADKRGERYKTFRVSQIGIKLDLFIVRPPAQWSVILAIRTGPAEFSRRLVTPRKQGGLLPSHLQVKDGALRHRANLARIVQTPAECDFFAALGLNWIPPEERV